MQSQLQILKGKAVEVDFHGMIYKGVLSDASMDEIFLRTEGGLLALPMDEVSDIRLSYQSNL